MMMRALALSGWLALAIGVSQAQAQDSGGNPGGPPSGAAQQDDGPGGHQGQGPPPRDHGDHGPNGPHHGPEHGQDRGPGGQDGPSSGGTVSTMRGGLQLGPPGRWWDDPEFAGSLHLRADQQTRMDAIFSQNKGTLLGRYSSLKDEERQLESLTRGANIDEKALFARIDRVTAARAELEKANAHMLLLLRHELTLDQVNMLDARRPPAR